LLFDLLLKDDCIWEEAPNLHAELKLILTQALLGDSLAADYLLFYLISDMYVECLCFSQKKKKSIF